jgi:hypothetical protein
MKKKTLIVYPGPTGSLGNLGWLLKKDNVRVWGTMRKWEKEIFHQKKQPMESPHRMWYVCEVVRNRNSQNLRVHMFGVCVCVCVCMRACCSYAWIHVSMCVRVCACMYSWTCTHECVCMLICVTAEHKIKH